MSMTRAPLAAFVLAHGPRVLTGRSGTRTKMLENGAVAPLLEGLKHKKYEVRSASVFALGELRERRNSFAASCAEPHMGGGPARSRLHTEPM